jgi:type IV pilus assembly protein PilM
LNKTLLDKATDFFRPQLPFWACEFTAKQVIVAGVDRKRLKIHGRAAVDLPAGAVAGSLTGSNVRDRDAVRLALKDALDRAGFRGFEIGVVIPDDAARITFLTAENLPVDLEERRTFIRWRLKKTLPFEVDTAQVAFREIRPSEFLIALSPRHVIEEYENLLTDIGVHAGFVTPSTLAALHLFAAPGEDTLFLKIAPDCITTSIFQNRKIQFYRRVSDASLYDAVYPTILYHQDKLAGNAIAQLTVCTSETAGRASLAELQEKFNFRIHRLEPTEVDDVFKPALGAVEFAVAV